MLASLQSCLPDGGSGSDGAGVAPGGEFLTVQDIEQILAQAIAEALARGVAGTIAVVDRVGNVLAVFRMDGAATAATITSGHHYWHYPI